MNENFIKHAGLVKIVRKYHMVTGIGYLYLRSYLLLVTNETKPLQNMNWTVFQTLSPDSFKSCRVAVHKTHYMRKRKKGYLLWMKVLGMAFGMNFPTY